MSRAIFSNSSNITKKAPIELSPEHKIAPDQQGGAPIMSDLSDRSDMSDQAPHQTLRQNQTAIQYWGAGLSVIPLIARDYRLPQVPGHRTSPASKPQAPNQRGGTPIKSDKSDRSDMSDTAPHRTLMHNQTAIQYWGAGLSVIPLAARDYRSPQVPGHRTNPASKPQAPNQRRRRTN